MKWSDIQSVFAFVAERPGLGLVALLTLLVAIYVVAAIQSAAKGEGGWKPVVVSSAIFLVLIALGAVLAGSTETDARALTLEEWFE